MRTLCIFVLVQMITISCEKGNSYCEQPFAVNSFDDLQATYDPVLPIEVSVKAELNFSADQEKTLFSFSVPGIFKNPKGDNYTTDVVAIPKYTYVLKDTINVPDSVEVEVYTFNDCGKSESIKGFIRFQ